MKAISKQRKHSATIQFRKCSPHVCQNAATRRSTNLRVASNFEVLQFIVRVRTFVATLCKHVAKSAKCRVVGGGGQQVPTPLLWAGGGQTRRLQDGGVQLLRAHIRRKPSPFSSRLGSNHADPSQRYILFHFNYECGDGSDPCKVTKSIFQAQRRLTPAAAS